MFSLRFTDTPGAEPMTDVLRAAPTTIARSADRTITTQTLAACPFSIAEEYATDYLRRAEAGEVEADVRVPIRFVPNIIRRRMNVTFGSHSDTLEAGRPHNELRVHWKAGLPALPTFNGTVRFRIAGSETSVIVEVTYRVPYGTLGRLFDHFVGSHVAGASISDFSRRIVNDLEARERAWRTTIA